VTFDDILVIANEAVANGESMKRSINLCVIAFALGACEAGVEEPFDGGPVDDASFRAQADLDMGPPAANAPVVATLTPGAVFEIGHRYAFAKGPGATGIMSQFDPENVDSIAHLRSGDIVAVKRNGKLSRARILGLAEDGSIQFVPQLGSPFNHAFVTIPWSAWGPAASDVAQCSQAVQDEWQPCVDTTANGGWCSDQAEDELDDCASAQSYSVKGKLGGIKILEFECMLPHPYSTTSLGDSMTMGTPPFYCDGSFWGTVTQEPGFFGCEDVYDGVWVADDPDCMDGPADTIVLHGAS